MIIITTVGTSSLTNLLKHNYDKFFGIKLSQILIDKLSDGSAKTDDLKNIDFGSILSGELKIENKKSKEQVLLDNKYPNLNINASAEIKSICKIAKGNAANVYLLATDTDMSEYAAEKIKETLNGKYELKVIFEKAKHRISGLKIEEPEKFQETGFEKLIGAIDKIYDKKESTILNISGGYKALIPFLTIYAQLKGLPINYIYEESKDLISIKPMPIDFDWAVAEIYNQFITSSDALKKLDEQSDVFNFLLNNGIVNKQKKLTTIGSLFEKYIKKYLPDRQDVIGHYMEHKLFQFLFENEYQDFKSFRLGEDFWWDTNDKTKFYSEQLENTLRVEIDLQLVNKNHKFMFIESKSFSLIGKAIKQIEKYIEFNNLALKRDISTVGIFVYKFSFQRINTGNFKNLISLCKAKNLKLYLFSFDVPINFERGTITYKKLFDAKLNLNENFFIEKLTN